MSDDSDSLLKDPDIVAKLDTLRQRRLNILKQLRNATPLKSERNKPLRPSANDKVNTLKAGRQQETHEVAFDASFGSGKSSSTSPIGNVPKALKMAKELEASQNANDGIVEASERQTSSDSCEQTKQDCAEDLPREIRVAGALRIRVQYQQSDAKERKQAAEKAIVGHPKKSQSVSRFASRRKAAANESVSSRRRTPSNRISKHVRNPR